MVLDVYHPFAFILWGLLFFVAPDIPLTIRGAGLLSLVPILIGWVYLVRWLFMAVSLAFVRSSISQNELARQCDFELVPGKLRVTTQVVSSSYDLRGIEDIVEDGGYTFIFTTVGHTFIIPMRSFESDRRDFIAKLQSARDHFEPHGQLEVENTPSEERIKAGHP
jgi:hypothetical protein